MTKRCLICIVAIILLSLCCGISFAAEKGNSINLGNEIMQSIDKTENSFKNVVSGNVVTDTTNYMKDGITNVGNSVRDMGREVTGTVNNMDNIESINNNDNTNNNKDNKADNNRKGNVEENYNAARTTAIAETINSGINSMSATTWMWIILILAAVIIMVAIWYYATQSNS